MKKFMKGCAITAAVFCLLGIVLAVAGWSARGSAAISEIVNEVTGGRVSVNLDNIKEWGVTIADSIDHVNYDLNEHSMFKHGKEILKGDVAKYSLGSAVEELDIEIGGGILTSEVSDDGNFYLKAEKAYKLQGYVEDGTLYIKASNGAKTWDQTGSCRITLYIPREFCFREADVEMGAGVMEISGLYAQESVSLEVGAGQILIDGIRAGELELEIGAGEIKLQDMEVGGEFSAEVGMGKMEAAGSVAGNASIECSMGNADLKLEEGEQDHNYALECAVGSINIGNRSYSGLAKETRINNNAPSTIDIECAMGNVTVSFGQDGIQ